MDDFEQRLDRVYAALEATREPNHSKVPVVVQEHQGGQTIGVNYSAGLSDSQLSNLAHGAIHNVAHLQGHAIRRARERGVSDAPIKQVVRQSLAVRIIIDLSNNDKHGYPPRNGGESGLAPKIANIERFMVMGAGSWAGVRITTDGVVAEGHGPILTSGRVVGKDGVLIGHLHTLLDEALVAWESVVSQLK